MSLSQPIRTLLLAALLISAALIVRYYFESDVPASVAEDDFTPPRVRVARDQQPTIVESDENWMNAPQRDLASESNATLGAPQVLDLPPLPARPETRRGVFTR